MGEERQVRAPTCRKLRERRRLRRLEGRPCFPCCVELSKACRSTRRPERLQLAGAELAQARERGLSRGRADDNQLGRSLRRMRERKRIDELQLIVEVVLEPENDVSTRVECIEELA